PRGGPRSRSTGRRTDARAPRRRTPRTGPVPRPTSPPWPARRGPQSIVRSWRMDTQGVGSATDVEDRSDQRVVPLLVTAPPVATLRPPATSRPGPPVRRGPLAVDQDFSRS